MSFTVCSSAVLFGTLRLTWFSLWPACLSLVVVLVVVMVVAEAEAAARALLNEIISLLDAGL